MFCICRLQYVIAAHIQVVRDGKSGVASIIRTAAECRSSNIGFYESFVKISYISTIIGFTHWQYLCCFVCGQHDLLCSHSVLVTSESEQTLSATETADLEAQAKRTLTGMMRLDYSKLETLPKAENNDHRFIRYHRKTH